jgi:hypothetical protein
MQAADAHLLQKLSSASKVTVTPEALHPDAQPGPKSDSRPESGQSLLPEAPCPNLTGCRTASAPPGAARPPLPKAGCPNPMGCRTASSWPGVVQSRLPEAMGPNRSGCRTALCHAPPRGSPAPEATFRGWGSPSRHSAFGMGMLLGHPEEGRGYMWSPVPWARASSPDGAGARAEKTCLWGAAPPGVPGRSGILSTGGCSRCGFYGEESSLPARVP